jgi:hypothetical protein
MILFYVLSNKRCDSEIVHTEPRERNIEYSEADIVNATEQLAFDDYGAPEAGSREHHC